jgi:hypothetical protein
MGHYDDNYEHAEQEERSNRAKELRGWINSLVRTTTNVDELELIYDVATNSEKYKVFFEVLRGKG